MWCCFILISIFKLVSLLSFEHRNPKTMSYMSSNIDMTNNNRAIPIGSTLVAQRVLVDTSHEIFIKIVQKIRSIHSETNHTGAKSMLKV